MTTVLAILAVWYCARQVSVEQGPFEVFSRFRNWYFEKRAEYDWSMQFLECPACTALIIAVPFAFFLPCPFVLSWLGLAGGAAAIHYFQVALSHE